MNARDNVERRDSGPILTREQMEEERCAQRRADEQAAYEHHINEACAAIQKTPYSLVTRDFIGQVLDTLACKAQEAKLFDECEAIELLSLEVTP